MQSIRNNIPVPYMNVPDDLRPSRHAMIPVHLIDVSPFQNRKYFDEYELQELAQNIRLDGLIEPIVVRPKGDRYELIVGERRWRAIRDCTDFDTISAIIVDADDHQTRRMAAAENLSHTDLSALEIIEFNISIIDTELSENETYRAFGATPLHRLDCLLGKLNAVKTSEYRGSQVADDAKMLFTS